MHPNPVFHDAETAQNLAFARARAFGVLAVSAQEAPLISHVPFLISEDGDWAELHLVRSNPIVRMLKEACPARIAVSGPDGYVSPDWYGVPDQVPTWNYVAVHLTGELELPRMRNCAACWTGSRPFTRRAWRRSRPGPLARWTQRRWRG